MTEPPVCVPKARGAKPAAIAAGGDRVEIGVGDFARREPSGLDRRDDAADAERSRLERFFHCLPPLSAVTGGEHYRGEDAVAAIRIACGARRACLAWPLKDRDGPGG